MKRILLVGKPNSGKSLLFNQLTGLRQKVANFPGVTVELKKGKFVDHELVDFPGTYSLNSLSRDEEIAIKELNKALYDDNTALVVCVLDATRLESSLTFGLQAQMLAQQAGKGFIFALNLIDELHQHNFDIDPQQLSTALGSPVYALSAKKLIGIAEFRQVLLDYLDHNKQPAPVPPPQNIEPLKKSREIAQRFQINTDIVLKKQNRIDSFLLNSFLGSIAFLVIMFFLFQSIFTWAAPLMDGVENIISYTASWLASFGHEGIINDFVNDAIFGGFGSFLVFVPQIMMLTFIIGILEDSGYLARAALICHKPLSYFGLSGRSFIPYLSGHACAIPAIMAARTIESPRKRLITMLTIPLMSCSARLPVYALLIAALVPNQSYLHGLVTLQGAAFFGLYLLGIVSALIVSLMLSKTQSAQLEQSDMPFVLELPTYRLPHWKPLLLRSLNSGQQFIKRAGPVIFAVSLIIWVLGYFPLHKGGLEDSYLGVIGHFIEPVFSPLGLDWRYGIAIIMSFLAREVFVGALGTLFGIEGADENIAGLAANIQADGLALGSGIGLLLFYVIALQCVATVAMLRAEIGSNKIVWGIYIGYALLAYCIALLAVLIF